MAQDGGIPPAEKQKAGQKAIALACKALEIHTQLQGTEYERVVNDMIGLGELLEHFNNNDDDEIPRLYEQAKSIFARRQGNSFPSVNVAICKSKMCALYYHRAMRAHAANDLDRYVAMLELALPHFHEAVRIARANGRMDMADEDAQMIRMIEARLRQVATAKAAAAGSRG